MTHNPDDVNAYLRVKLPTMLSSHNFNLLTTAGELAETRGGRLYLVAGCVRDCLLGRQVHDIDIAVEGSVLLLAREMATLSGAELEAFEQFGTATLRVSGDLNIDLVSTRKETYTLPGTLPVVEQGNIHDDLARRDFSVNALAVPLSSGGVGDLLDPQGGIDDLLAQVIRVLHDLSFRDDPTRIFRAVKFARRLDFSIEKNTLELILQAVRDGALYTVSVDRITREILLILEEPQADAMLWDLDRFGVLGAIHPLLSWPYEPGKIRPEQDELLTREERRDIYLVLLGAEMGHDHEGAEKVARWLNLPAPHVRLVRDGAQLARLWPQLGDDDQSNWQLYNLLRNLELKSLQAYMRVSVLQADRVPWSKLKLYLGTLRHIKPEVSGDYLRELGVTPGPLYARLLAQLLEAKIEGRVPTKADEEDFLRGILTQQE